MGVGGCDIVGRARFDAMRRSGPRERESHG
ncbi:hypothetical protein K788_00040325 [Paraburkholderia caribensis MBA4]|uniref:Uncharacterized protein n=1 Tax=Paraburkholderia caribensis MBA4 TaxID=1323664 RepID=A0A0P0R634_9BURK|nr:hypothetical protein K788_00040325 [Paraburkholderia caribensis MBA4]